MIAGRFVAGTTIASALDVVRALNDEGMTAALDFLGEDVASPDQARRTRDSYLAVIDAVGTAGVRANVSLKLSALGLLIDPELAYAHLCRILESARTLPDPFVRIDMEGSALVEATLSTFVRAFRSYSNVGPVLQAYLHRTGSDVLHMITLGARVRLCKGAYNEPPAIALRDPNLVRERYSTFAAELLRHGNHPAFATHDRILIDDIRRRATRYGITSDRFEFEMLYGVRPALQREMVAAGHRVRIYVPFGTHWQRYFWRRIRERRENALFALRSLLGR
jgi:proline dehydrogenase